jgi:hypothetical protein
MVGGVLRVRNAYPAGEVTPPVTTPDRHDRPVVTVDVEWEDGRTSTVAGSALRWTADAVLVAFSGPDGLGRQEWFSSEVVRRD